MKKIKPVSEEEVKKIALPILTDGYEKRKKSRADWEETKRAEMKRNRDHESKPKICKL